jgi:hypothetical protein
MASLIETLKMSLKCGDLVKNLKIFNESLFAEETEPEAAANTTPNDTNNKSTANDSQMSAAEDEDENKPRAVVQSRYSLRIKKKAEDAIKEINSMASDDEDESSQDENEVTEVEEANFDHFLNWIHTDDSSYSIDELVLVSLK